jgi:hypothetical protein
MRRSGNPTALIDEVARFQAEVRRLAFAAVRAVIQQELDRRPAKPKTARQRKRQPALPPKRKPVGQPALPPKRKPAVQLELGFAQAPERQLELPLARQAEIQPERKPAGATDPSDAPVVPAAVTPEPPPNSPTGGRKRVPWTRESIISELATWMLSGTVLDAQFMTRHGPPGLVSAIRRVFGRFEAALNVAALHVSKLYPDGPPARRLS